MRPVLDAALTRAGLRARSVIEVGWVANAWALVNEGVGVALVDDFSLLENVYPDIVTRPFEPEIPIVAEVLHPRSKSVSRLAAEFVNVAREVLTKSCGRPARQAPVSQATRGPWCRNAAEHTRSRSHGLSL